MDALGIIGLLAGIVILIVVSYKGFHAVPTTILAAAVVLLLNGINLWTGFSTAWIGGLAGVFTAYYLLFLFSTIFANFMQETGACTTVAYKLIDWFGKKHIMTVLTILCFVLCFGGVSFFVIMFAIGPIAFSMFAELNVPRKAIILPVAAGAGAFVLACPASTQLSNVIPTALGTSLTAAPILGIIMLVVGMAVSIIYCEKAYAKMMKEVAEGKDPGWVPDANIPALRGREEVPGALGGFLPLFVVVALIIVGSILKWFGGNATELAVIAMIAGTLVCMLLNFKFFQGKLGELFKGLLAKSAVGAAGSALVLGAVVGFGTVVSNTPAFTKVVAWVMGIQIPVYWKAVIATAVLAGVCGSASSGAKLVMQYLGEYFVGSGANLAILHRLIANASVTFDSLPHATGCFLMLSYFGLNHKIAYKHIFWLDTIIPLAITLIATLICSIAF